MPESINATDSGTNNTTDIVLQDVSYSLQETTLLSSISLVATERRIGVVGRNGSGKSTLARLLCGLIEPSTGSLQVAGVDVANDRFNAIRTVGMLFQNPDHQVIFPTVAEELAFGLQQLRYPRDLIKKEVRSALEKFNVVHWSEKSVSTLSQGQRHLVCLIAVLLMKPKLIVLDEPYAGLDLPTTIQLSRMLNSIDAMIVHVSHQIDTLNDYSRILWLDGGKLVMDGDPASVLCAYTTRMKTLGSADALV